MNTKNLSKEDKIKKAFKSARNHKVNKRTPKKHVSDTESEMFETSDGSDSN